MDEFELELKMGFLDEASQLISEVEQCFLDLESNPSDRPTLDKIFRIAHNLKGSAKAVGFDGLGEFTHEMESYLIKMKDGTIPVSGPSIGLLLQCNDQVVLIINSLRADLSAVVDCSALMAELKDRIASGFPDAAIETEQSQTQIYDDFQGESIPAAAEFDRPTHSEETRSNEILPQEVPSKIAKAPAHAADESIRVSLNRLEKLLNHVAQMVILHTVLKEQAYADNPILLRKTVHQIGKVTKEVQDLSMSLRMVPMKQTFQKMQRIVRDTSSSLGKKVQLTMRGDETEVDKTVLENLSDPLVHLIRNAVDHGIETPEQRQAAGKTNTAEIILSACHQGGSLLIEVRDNGAGLDPDRLRKKAIEKGVIKPGQVISDKDAYQLIFSSGFSTKAVVTDVSGRGVGMDVVKTSIERLQGDIQIETTLGVGTCFKVRLPLTLAIIDGMIIHARNERYVIPLSHVHESLRPTEKEIHSVTGLGEVLNLRGENIPLIRLAALFGATNDSRPIHESTVIVIRPEGHAFAIVVDDIIGQHQVVIKQLGPEHKDLRGFSGSSILGDGRPALILEMVELVKRYRPQVHNHEISRRAAV